MMKKTDERTDGIKQKLIDTSIFVILIFTLLIIPLLFLRSKGVFTLGVIIALIASISLLALHVFKEKVSLKFKIYIIIVLLGSVIINGLINFGFIASGKPYIILLSVFLSYVLPSKRVYTFLFVFISIYAIIAFLYINGYLTYNFNIINQINQPATWIIDGFILLIISVILISVGNKIRYTLTENFDNLTVSNSLLRDREEKYKSLFDNDELAVIILQDKVIVECNKKTLDLFKCKEEDVIGKEPYELSPKYQPDGILSKEKAQTLEDFSNENPSIIHHPEWQHINSQGELFLVSSSITPISLSTGFFLYIVLKDITKIKALELKAQLTLDALKFKNEELQEFAYITSHDLQEPLRTISSFTKLINDEHKDELSEDLKTYINFISESSDRLRDLITNLLDYTRLGNLEKTTLVDCNVLIKEILADLSVSISESKSKISLVDPLPTITGSKPGLRILFQNLISNAIKFKKKDTLPQVKISFKEDSEKWMFSIQDNGIGMKEKDLTKIFSLFTRLHKRDSYEGTGIGLAYSMKIVKSLNGDIWVDSEVGKGSTFYFTISKNLL